MINEFDINDWEQLPVAPLYNVPRNTPISVDDHLFFFHKIDGAYSLCHSLVDKMIYHISASTQVIPYARIDKQKKAS